MAVKISLINMKGGVGKSTLTVNLAWHFAGYLEWSKRVLVVDLDPQFNASQYLLGVSEYEKILNSKKPTIWNIFEQGTKTPGAKSSALKASDVILTHRTFTNGGSPTGGCIPVSYTHLPTPPFILISEIFTAILRASLPKPPPKPAPLQ